jgi:diguanylate cyclase (GGDEF)-like protein/PAS domain S-box-containing protein
MEHTMKKSSRMKADLRRLAEAKLKERKEKTQPNVDAARLIHDLEAHQIELEMQNEELSQARAKAEEVYRQYTDLYDFAPVGYFTLGRDGTILETNLAGANLLGVDRVKLLNRQLGLFVAKEALPTFSDFLQRLSSEEGRKKCEIPFGEGGNELVWANIEATCFEGGQESRAVMVDITERKQMVQALEESEKRFRTILQDVPTIAVQGYAADGATQYWNSASERLYGYSAQEAIGQNLLDLIIPPEMKNEVRQAIQQMAETGKPIPSAELSLMRKDGSRVPVYSSHAVVSTSGREPELFCLDIDLTERKRAEEALRQSEERFRALFDKAPLGYQALDADGRFLDVNQAWLDTLGYSREEVLGRWFSEFLAPEYAEAFLKRFAIFKAGGQIHSEFEMLHKDGSRHWVAFEGRIGYELNGEFKQTHCILQDITESRKAEKALRESQELFSLFMRHSPIYVFIKEVTPTESRVLQASDNYQQMIGVSGRDMIGRNMQGLFPAEFAARITADDWSVINNNMVLKVDEDLNGRHYTSIKFPIFQGGKSLLAGYTIDITERVQAEIALKESEFFIKSVLNSLAAHIAVLNEQATIVAVNETWRKFARENGGNDSTGYVGVNYLSVCQSAIASGDLIAQQVAQGIRAVMEQSQPQFSIEYQCDAPAQPRWFSVTVLPMAESHRGAVIIHQDVTERKRVELEMQYMRATSESANRELKAALAREQQLAHTDVLTGINNRRHLYELAEHEFEIAARYKQPLSVMMFDIDHFKLVNDTFGHMAGDQILQLVTQAAGKELRSADVFGRYGGEEFVIILPVTNAQQSHPLAERIRERVAAIQVPTEKGIATVTLSIGIVEMTGNKQAASAEDLIRRADEAMYAAKQAGRNRTEIGE